MPGCVVLTMDTSVTNTSPCTPGMLLQFLQWGRQTIYSQMDLQYNVLTGISAIKTKQSKRTDNDADGSSVILYFR